MARIARRSLPKHAISLLLLLSSVTICAIFNGWQRRAAFFVSKDIFPILVPSPQTQPCSYKLLYNSFISTNINMKSDKERHRDCWSPKDEVLRIPVDAIVNRDNLDQLGAGNKGGVYRAILNLDGSGNTGAGGRTCTVGLKTEECMYSQNGIGIDGMTSCVSRNAQNKNDNNMWKEFMGGFLFIATRKAGIELPSLIPTWGMVVDEQQPPTIVGENISYPSVVGMVMPIMELITIKDVAAQKLTDIAPNTSLGLARMMLPTAETYLFMEQLGMSSQHIGRHNMGVPTPNSQYNGAFVYDNSYLSFLNGTNCSFDMNQSNVCNICDKKSLTHTHRNGTRHHKKEWTSDIIWARDCMLFGRNVKALLKVIMPHKDDAQSLELLRDYFDNDEDCRMADVVLFLSNFTRNERR